MEKEDLQVEKLDDGIPILQLTRSRIKKKKETEKHGFKPGSKLD